ncbi:hypothetical protein KM043_000673 [Ampulex compressa]|nr:hypothetical protein KM043_000673 [Ampulex compressa]
MQFLGINSSLPLFTLNVGKYLSDCSTGADDATLFSGTVQRYQIQIIGVSPGVLTGHNVCHNSTFGTSPDCWVLDNAIVAVGDEKKNQRQRSTHERRGGPRLSRIEDLLFLWDMGQSDGRAP